MVLPFFLASFFQISRQKFSGGKSRGTPCPPPPITPLGYLSLIPYFSIICVFLKKENNFGQNIQWIWLEMFQGTQRSQFYFRRDHGCKVTLEYLWKSICGHVLIHKSIATWVSEIPVRFLRMLPIRNMSYLSPMCCHFWEKYTNSHKVGLGCSTSLKGTGQLLPHPQLFFQKSSDFNTIYRYKCIPV